MKFIWAIVLLLSAVHAEMNLRGLAMEDECLNEPCLSSGDCCPQYNCCKIPGKSGKATCKPNGWSCPGGWVPDDRGLAVDHECLNEPCISSGNCCPQYNCCRIPGKPGKATCKPNGWSCPGGWVTGPNDRGLAVDHECLNEPCISSGDCCPQYNCCRIPGKPGKATCKPNGWSCPAGWVTGPNDRGLVMEHECLNKPCINSGDCCPQYNCCKLLGKPEAFCKHNGWSCPGGWVKGPDD